MLRFLADENFNGVILNALFIRASQMDVIRVQDTAMYQASDIDLLNWAAAEDRIILTHDRNTLAGYAYDRVKKGKYMPGVVEVSRHMNPGRAAEEILLFAECMDMDEVVGIVHYIPL